MSTEQLTRVDGDLDALVNSEAATVDLSVEAYEGKVAIHTVDADQDSVHVDPIVSLRLSPVDAAVHAERILAAARKALADPDYTP